MAKENRRPRSHMICDNMGLGRITKAQSFILYNVYDVFGFKNELCFLSRVKGSGGGGGGGGAVFLLPSPLFLAAVSPPPPPFWP